METFRIKISGSALSAAKAFCQSAEVLEEASKMSLFIGILDKLMKRIDKCTALPNSSILRVKLLIEELDDEEKERIDKEMRKDGNRRDKR